MEAPESLSRGVWARRLPALFLQECRQKAEGVSRNRGCDEDGDASFGHRAARS